MLDRILFVDDNADAREAVGALLEPHFDIDIAEGGNEAFRMYAQAMCTGNPYDLIVLDLAMPEVDGFTVAKKIRETDESTKICFLTAYARESMAQVIAREVHAIALWSKPVSGLLDKIRGALNGIGGLADGNQ